jgi:hypothetical protein
MGRPEPCESLPMQPLPDSTAIANAPLDLTDSPLYLLAVLFSARRSKDRALERVTRRRLNALGIRVMFGDELHSAKKSKGGSRE